MLRPAFKIFATPRINKASGVGYDRDMPTGSVYDWDAVDEEEITTSRVTSRMPIGRDRTDRNRADNVIVDT